MKILNPESNKFKVVAQFFQMMDEYNIQIEFCNYDGCYIVCEGERYLLRETMGGTTTELPPLTEYVLKIGNEED